MVVSPINVMLTINVIKVSHKCNTHYKCNKLLTINVIMHQSIETPTPQVPGKGGGK